MFPDGSSSDLTLEVTLQSLTRQNVNTELHTVHIHTNAKFTKVVFTRKSPCWNLNIQHLQKYQKRIPKVRIRYQLSTISNAFPCITNRLKPFKHTQTRSMESFMIGETIEEQYVWKQDIKIENNLESDQEIRQPSHSFPGRNAVWEKWSYLALTIACRCYCKVSGEETLMTQIYNDRQMKKSKKIFCLVLMFS